MPSRQVFQSGKLGGEQPGAMFPVNPVSELCSRRPVDKPV